MGSHKLLLLLTLSSILYGCSASVNFAGKYTSNGHKIQIKEDSSFAYEYRYHSVYYQSSGKWDRVRKRMIALNSTIKNTDSPMVVKRADLNKDDAFNNISIDLNIIEGSEKSNYSCIIYINDKIFVMFCNYRDKVSFCKAIQRNYSFIRHNNFARK